MMSKKDFQLFADMASRIDDDTNREEIINFLCPVFRQSNFRFSEERFRDWIHRRRNNLSMKGTHYNPKYMPLGIGSN